jgi:hypothetical protein
MLGGHFWYEEAKGFNKLLHVFTILFVNNQADYLPQGIRAYQNSPPPPLRPGRSHLPGFPVHER